MEENKTTDTQEKDAPKTNPAKGVDSPTLPIKHQYSQDQNRFEKRNNKKN